MKTLKTLINEVRVAARFPTGRDRAGNEPDDPDDTSLRVDLQTAQRNRGAFESNMNTLRDTYQDIDKRELEGISHDEVAEKYIEHFKKNILHIHDNMTEEKRRSASGWYDTANRMAHSLYNEHKGKSAGLTPEGVAGAFAALSPSTDWNNNISQAKRLMSIYHDKRHEAWSPEMEDRARKIWKPKDHHILNDIRGKSLHEISHLSTAHKAMWIRTYDEAHNSNELAKYDAEGNETGEKGKVAWQSLPNIAKAVGCIESGGDTKIISRLMGYAHKVRAFYNNIAAPNDPGGDVTIDTHAVAASHLKPLSQSAPEVEHAFGDGVASGGAATGLKGTNYLHQEAYRRAARERGILPRQMQSIAWEGIKSFFSNKSGANAKRAAAVWVDHHNGLIDADTARERIKGIMAQPVPVKAKVTKKPKVDTTGTLQENRTNHSRTIKVIRNIR